MAIPLPSGDNFPEALVAWREHEPVGSRVTGLAIISNETESLWSVNYSCVNKNTFPEPQTRFTVRVRRILQEKAPINVVLRKVTVVEIPTLECKWQALYKTKAVLDEVQEARASLEAASIVDTITLDAATGITTELRLKNLGSSPSQEVQSTEKKRESSGKTIGKKTSLREDVFLNKPDIQQIADDFVKIDNLAQDLKIRSNMYKSMAYKSLNKVTVLKNESGDFKSKKHRNVFFAMLRIASKNIRGKEVKPIPFVKGETLEPYASKKVQKEEVKKESFNAVPPPKIERVCHYNMRYFERTDLAQLVSMRILYNKGVAYQHLTSDQQASRPELKEGYIRDLVLWAKGQLLQRGVPLFDDSEGLELYHELLKKFKEEDSSIRKIAVPAAVLARVAHANTW